MQISLNTRMVELL